MTREDRDWLVSAGWFLMWAFMYVFILVWSAYSLVVLYWPVGVPFAAFIGWFLTMYVISIVRGIRADDKAAEIERHR